jgi:hypothetical protein
MHRAASQGLQLYDVFENFVWNSAIVAKILKRYDNGHWIFNQV